MRDFFHTTKHREGDLGHPAPPRRARRREWPAVARGRAALAVLGLWLGLVCLSRPEAVADLLQHCQRNPVPESDRQPVDVLFHRIDWSAASGRPDEVARLCDILCRLYPEDPLVPEVRARRIDALMTLGDPAALVEELHRYEQHVGRGAALRELLIEVAAWQLETGACRDAAQSYTDLLALSTRADGWAAGEDAAPPAPLGRSLRRWRAHQYAERSRTETERLARFNLAVACERGGEFEAAERAYTRFAARFPEDSLVCEARVRSASLALRRSDLPTALAGFRAVATDTTTATSLRCEAIYRAGRVQEALQRPDIAVAMYLRALPLRPAADPFRMAALAAAAPLLEERAPEQAVAIYRELVALSTDAAVRAAALARLHVLEPSTSLATAAR